MKRIAILVESSRAFGRGLIHGINTFASKQDDWVLYYHEGTLNFDLQEWLKYWQGDGIIARVTDEAHAEIFANSSIPTVDLLGEIVHPDISVVNPDNASIAQLAVQFYINAGYTNLAYCGYSGIHFSDQRQSCYREAAHNQHLEVISYHPTQNISDTILRREQWRPQREEDLAAWLQALPKPVAIFTCNDVRALDLSTACLISNIRVPEDVAILGVDNDELICTMAKPPLSSIEPDTIQQGNRGAQILHQLMSEAETPVSREVIPPKAIIERPSTDLIAFSNPVVADAARYLRKNIHLNIGAQQIAEAAGTSASHLNRLFKEATGFTLNKEIQRLRLIRIRHLLRHSELTLIQIARQTGFSSAANLSKFFKSKTETTPGKYREYRTGSRLDTK